MGPTSFEFTLIMPVDVRLVSAVRQLAAHAAAYAQLPADAARDLGEQVEHATRTAVDLAGPDRSNIEVHFSATTHSLDVKITCDASAALHAPATVSGRDTTVSWTREGSRQTCRIQQRIPA
jgi:hypothetical protein